MTIKKKHVLLIYHSFTAGGSVETMSEAGAATLGNELENCVDKGRAMTM